MSISKKLRAFFESAAYKAMIAEEQRRGLREQALQEDAPWFGQTGLDEIHERELPRYLRREYGEDIFSDPNALKAADLRYLGKTCSEEGSECHYWQVPGHEISYATITRRSDGALCFSCGLDALPEAVLPPAADAEPN